MVLRCLGSSSKGNCYLLTAANGETLMIEAGVDFSEVKQALKFDLSRVAGCVVSHEHMDHCRYLPKVLINGIKVLALKEVFSSFHNELRGLSFAEEIIPLHGYKVGGFSIFTLSVKHDVPCLGFIIEHPEMGRLLFVIDTMMLEYRVSKLSHILIEANYSDDILQANIDKGMMPSSMKKRLMSTHMEIGTTLDILRANDLSQVREVVLLHLSATNANSVEFTVRAEKVAGRPVYIADRGFEIELSKTSY